MVKQALEIEMLRLKSRKSEKVEQRLFDRTYAHSGPRREIVRYVPLYLDELRLEDE